MDQERVGAGYWRLKERSDIRNESRSMKSSHEFHSVLCKLWFLKTPPIDWASSKQGSSSLGYLPKLYGFKCSWHKVDVDLPSSNCASVVKVWQN